MNHIFLGKPSFKIKKFIEDNRYFPDCLCFTCESESGSVGFVCTDARNQIEYPLDRSLQYSINNQQSWSQWDGSSINLTQGQKVYIRALNDNIRFYGFDDQSFGATIRKFRMSGQIAGSGNIQYLLTADGSRMDIPTDRCYMYIFAGCHSLTQAPELPATTLTNECYRLMFNACKSLTKAPKLPAIILTDSCYSSMFDNCTSLTQAPDLPAITLASSCYSRMFYNCTSLTQAPELPATTLANNCYYYIFAVCTNMSKDIHMKSSVNGTYSTNNHGTLISGQNIIYDL